MESNQAAPFGVDVGARKWHKGRVGRCNFSSSKIRPRPRALRVDRHQCARGQTWSVLGAGGGLIVAKDKGPCPFPGCPNRIGPAGLCGPHYQQRRVGRQLSPLRVRITPGGPCSFLGCSRQAKVAGLCQPHYQQKNMGLSLSPLRRSPLDPKGPCQFTGCTNAIYSTEWCRGHYEQRATGRELAPLRRRKGRPGQDPPVATMTVDGVNFTFDIVSPVHGLVTVTAPLRFLCETQKTIFETGQAE